MATELKDLRLVDIVHPNRQFVHLPQIDDNAIDHPPHFIVAIILSDEEKQDLAPTRVQTERVPLVNSWANGVEPAASRAVAFVFPQGPDSFFEQRIVIPSPKMPNI